MIHKNSGKFVLICSFIMISSVNCASPGKSTGIGAGAGAATGAAIGGALGGWKGAGVGALLGTATGGSIGNYLDKQAQELKQVANTKRTKDGILVKLKNDLLFGTGSAVLKDTAIDDISSLGDILSKYPDDRIKIEGFTDNVGKADYNESLSIRRAEAVRRVLIGRGVKDNQMIVLGFGETKPISDNATRQGRAANRRVELHIDVPQKT